MTDEDISKLYTLPILPAEIRKDPAGAAYIAVRTATMSAIVPTRAARPRLNNTAREKQRSGEKAPFVLLLLLLLSVDLAPSGTRLNTGDSFKSKTDVDNKRHTNAHQPSPPTHQLGLQSPPLRHSTNHQ
jgi:hypothetical protein